VLGVLFGGGIADSANVLPDIPYLADSKWDDDYRVQ